MINRVEFELNGGRPNRLGHASKALMFNNKQHFVALKVEQGLRSQDLAPHLASPAGQQAGRLGRPGRPKESSMMSF